MQVGAYFAVALSNFDGEVWLATMGCDGGSFNGEGGLMNMGHWILQMQTAASMQVGADSAVFLSNFDGEVWLATMGGGGGSFNGVWV